jgi:hypothetical protein
VKQNPKPNVKPTKIVEVVNSATKQPVLVNVLPAKATQTVPMAKSATTAIASKAPRLMVVGPILHLVIPSQTPHPRQTPNPATAQVEIPHLLDHAKASKNVPQMAIAPTPNALVDVVSQLVTTAHAPQASSVTPPRNNVSFAPKTATAPSSVKCATKKKAPAAIKNNAPVEKPPTPTANAPALAKAPPAPLEKHPIQTTTANASPKSVSANPVPKMQSVASATNASKTPRKTNSAQQTAPATANAMLDTPVFLSEITASVCPPLASVHASASNATQAKPVAKVVALASSAVAMLIAPKPVTFAAQMAPAAQATPAKA